MENKNKLHHIVVPAREYVIKCSAKYCKDCHHSQNMNFNHFCTAFEKELSYKPKSCCFETIRLPECIKAEEEFSRSKKLEPYI
jgi:hypothetical protein